MDKVLNLIVNGDPRGAISTFAEVKKGALGAKVGVAALAGGAILAGKALYDMGEEFDNGYDKIRVATGKTGKALEGLKSVAKDAFGNLPASFDEVSTAVAEVNQRLDAAGKQNQKLTEQFVELSRITGSDLSGNIKAVAQAFEDAEIPIKQQPKMLDYLFRAYQKSGTPVEQLAKLMKEFGSPLRQLGINFKESAAMFALFEKVGVNVQTMVPGLKFALKTFLSEGRDPAKALQNTFKGIQEGTISSTKALKIFGQRAGADMVEAINQGRFSFQDFQETLENGNDTILKAGDETKDASERFQELGNNLKLKVEPAATAVFNAVGQFAGELAKLEFKSPISGAIAFAAAAGGVVVAIGLTVKALQALKLAMLENPWTAAFVGISLIAGALIGLHGEGKKEISMFGRMKQAMKNVEGSSRRLASQEDVLRDAKRRSKNATHALRGEEHKLKELRQKGADHNSIFRQELAVATARRKAAKATKGKREQEELLAFFEKNNRHSIGEVIHTASTAIAAEKKHIKVLKDKVKVEGFTPELVKKVRTAYQRLGKAEETRREGIRLATKTNQKWGESLKNMTIKQHEFGAKGNALKKAIHSQVEEVKNLREGVSKGGGIYANAGLKRAERELRELKEEQRRFNKEVGRIPKNKKTKVEVEVEIKGIGGGGNSRGSTGGKAGTGDGWGIQGKLNKGIKKEVDKKAKEYVAKHPNKFMGYSGALPPHVPGAVEFFTQFAKKFGLSVSSGYRPGSITSSGNVSYHAFNRARDYSNGTSTPQELEFGKFMSRTFGRVLKELIHTPLGFSIKDGAIVPPYAAAEHYDHVHVAYQQGGQAKGFMVPGQGSGDKVPLSILAEPNESVFVLNRNATKALGTLNALNSAIPRFQKGGGVTGRVTWFNGGATAGGSNTSRPGLALNLHPGTDAGWNNDTTQGWMDASRSGHPVYAKVTVGGKSANLPITDLGPAGWTGNAIDVTEGGVKKLGFTTSNFPSGTTGKATILGSGGAGGAGGGKGKAQPKIGVGKAQVVTYPPMKKGQVPKGVKGLGHGISGLFTKPYDTASERRANVFAAAEQGLEIAEQTASINDDRKVNQFILGASKKRKAKVNKEIEKVQKELTKKRLSPKEKKKLRGKLGHLEEERGELQGRIGTSRENLKEITGIGLRRGNAELALARAEGTSNKADDIPALNSLKEIAEQELERAKKSGDPREIAEATRNLTQATQDLKDAAVAAYTEQKDAEWALAQLTESKEDDIKIANERKAFAEQELARAQSEGNWQEIQHWAEEVKQWGDTAKDLTNAVEENTSELKALREEMELNRRIAESEAAVSGVVARRALADIISGQLGPRAHHKAQVAGPGTVSRY